eukprot:CAMPEP_0197034970 /NCGR_PEP_ID=MMETSP1384-20130603/12880_1 /TAXON_ID=29189 /ORGANISM="Ammonia sp." /LENGTH=723 /DNA_ID=CAMNT_0042464949 /DNA_START=62 /DNA_END=2233 /DNA_ORIENTATION=+
MNQFAFFLISTILIQTSRSQNIAWFKQTQFHQQNIELLANGWTDCPMNEWEDRIDSVFDLEDDSQRFNLTAQCITFQVPLDWNDPASLTDNLTAMNSVRTIDQYITRVFDATDPLNTERRGAFWMLQGGPGVSGQTLYGISVVLMNFLDDTFDVYLPDHRGTGFSHPFYFCEMDVEPTPEQCWQIVERKMGAEYISHFTIYAAGMDLGYLTDLLSENLSAYNADNDIVFGTSYGGLWANHYLVLFPDQMSAAILENTQTPHMEYIQWDNETHLTGMELLSRCNDDAFCSSVFENELNMTVFEAVNLIFDELNHKKNVTLKCLQGAEKAVNGTASEAMASLFFAWITNIGKRLLIPPFIFRLIRCNEDDVQVIDEVVNRYGYDFSWMEAVIQEPDSDEQEVFNFNASIDEDEPSGGFNHALFYNIIYSEAWTHDWSDPGPSYREAVQLEQTYYFLKGYAKEMRTGWDVWGRYTPNPLTYQQYADPPIPMLIMAGGLDPQTYYNEILLAAQKWKASTDDAKEPNELRRYFVTFPDAAHGLMVTSPIRNWTDITSGLDHDFESCAMYIIKSFLVDPERKYFPDTSCIRWLTPIDFAGVTNISVQFANRYFEVPDLWQLTSTQETETTVSGAVTTEEEGESTTESGNLSVMEEGGDFSEEAQKWFITAIVFIVLFVVAMLVIAYLAYLLRDGASTKKVSDSRGNYAKYQNGANGDAGTLHVVAEDSD